MKFDIKNILIGVVIGVFGTMFIGDVDIQTEIQLGEKLDQDNKDIRIRIESNIDEDGREMINVSAIGRGSVTEEDIKAELGKLYLDKDIEFLPLEYFQNQCLIFHFDWIVLSPQALLHTSVLQLHP